MGEVIERLITAMILALLTMVMMYLAAVMVAWLIDNIWALILILYIVITWIIYRW